MAHEPENRGIDFGGDQNHDPENGIPDFYLHADKRISLRYSLFTIIIVIPIDSLE